MFFISISFLAFAMGVASPYWILKVGEAGTFFGVAMGVSLISQAISSYITGKLYNNTNAKYYLSLTTVLSGIVLYGYSFVLSIPMLLCLQIAFGSLLGIGQTLQSMVVLHKDFGKYHMLITFMAGIAMALTLPSPIVTGAVLTLIAGGLLAFS